MPKEKCEINELFIEQFADGELDYKESAEISAHLKTCAECRQKYEDIMFAKSAAAAFTENEKLSSIEREGLLSLINQEAESNTSFTEKLLGMWHNQTAAIIFSAFSSACLIAAFVFSLSSSDKENNLVIEEIFNAHNQIYPDEFSSNSDAKKKLDDTFKDTSFAAFTKRTSVRGRFTSIAATPTAKIRFNSEEDNVKGTLLLSKKNERLDKLFEESECILKKNNVCKAKKRSESGKELFYWTKENNDYLMVSDEDNAADKMVRLISTNF